MLWILLVSLPPLAGALAYGRAPLFAWLVAGLAWLLAAGWAGNWGFGWTLLDKFGPVLNVSQSLPAVCSMNCSNTTWEPRYEARKHGH